MVSLRPYPGDRDGPFQPMEIAWIVMSFCFLIYLLDMIAYSSIAACAVIMEWLRPEPGMPAYEKRQRRRAPSSKQEGTADKEVQWVVNHASGLDESVEVYKSAGSSASCDVETDINNAGSPQRQQQQQQQQRKEEVQVELQPQMLIPGVSLDLIKQYPSYPMVLVQLPMFNELSHCQRIIRDACRIAWPLEKLLIQVGDDSTNQDCRDAVDETVAEMQALGFPVQLIRRTDRTGYKAGNLIVGLKEAPLIAKEPVKYVLVLDADFVPPADMLYQTIYHMEKDESLGFVQGCWAHANRSQNWITWFQAVNLDTHFAVEQRSRSFVRTFFGFNGTAGVWRLRCMEETGGWSIDTTVEDMDLSIRAFCDGWKFKYLHHVKVPSELPADMATYRTQQYRWQSGPQYVAKKCLQHVWGSKKISLSAKLSASWFFCRMLGGGLAVAACTAIPPLLLFSTFSTPWRFGWPEILLMIASNAYVVFYIIFTPLGWIPYALISTCISYYRVYCQLMGLIGTKKSRSWKVTNKTGAGVSKSAPQPEVTTVVHEEADGTYSVCPTPMKLPRDASRAFSSSMLADNGCTMLSGPSFVANRSASMISDGNFLASPRRFRLIDRLESGTGSFTATASRFKSREQIQPPSSEQVGLPGSVSSLAASPGLKHHLADVCVVAVPRITKVKFNDRLESVASEQGASQGSPTQIKTVKEPASPSVSTPTVEDGVTTPDSTAADETAVVIDMEHTTPAAADEPATTPDEPAKEDKKKKKRGKAYRLELVVCAYYATFVGLSIWQQNYILAGYCGLMASTLLLISTTDLWATKPE